MQLYINPLHTNKLIWPTCSPWHHHQSTTYSNLNTSRQSHSLNKIFTLQAVMQANDTSFRHADGISGNETGWFFFTTKIDFTCAKFKIHLSPWIETVIIKNLECYISKSKSSHEPLHTFYAQLNSIQSRYTVLVLNKE